MTELRLTRRRMLSVGGAATLGAGGLWAIPSRRISVSLTTFEWVLSFRERGPAPVPSIRDLEPAAREAVRSAIKDRYETNDPPAAVRQLFHVGRPTYVRADGTYYRLDPTLPVYEIWHEPVGETQVEDPLTFDELEECTHPDPRGFVPPPHGDRNNPARRYYLRPQEQACLEEHPFVELGDGNVHRYHIAIDDPGAPYSIDAVRVPAKTVAEIEGPVAEWRAVPEDARELLLTAESDTLHRQEVSASLRELASEYDFVRREGRFFEIDLDHPGGAPIRVEARVIDDESREFDPAWLELSVTNTGDRTVELNAGPPASLAPFGVLFGEQVEGDAAITLWSPAYVSNTLIGSPAGRVIGVASAGVGVNVTPGQTRAARYAVRRNPGRLKRGLYRIRDGFGVEAVDDETDSTTFPFELDVRIE